MVMVYDGMNRSERRPVADAPRPQCNDGFRWWRIIAGGRSSLRSKTIAGGRNTTIVAADRGDHEYRRRQGRPRGSPLSVGRSALPIVGPVPPIIAGGRSSLRFKTIAGGRNTTIAASYEIRRGRPCGL